jgi:predicted helicase
MPTDLRSLLRTYRAKAISEREKGTYFEQLTKVWLEDAPTQRAQFKRVLDLCRLGERKPAGSTRYGY